MYFISNNHNINVFTTVKVKKYNSNYYLNSIRPKFEMLIFVSALLFTVLKTANNIKF